MCSGLWRPLTIAQSVNAVYSRSSKMRRSAVLLLFGAAVGQEVAKFSPPTPLPPGPLPPPPLASPPSALPGEFLHVGSSSGLGSDAGLFACTGVVRDGVCYPNVCAAASDWDFKYVPMLNEMPYRHHGYQTGYCANKVDIGDIYAIANITTAAYNVTHYNHIAECDRENDEIKIDGALLLILCTVVYMFYGLAHVCEDFLVPALELLCERYNIPDDVAGATLLAAGCNAPELFASIVSVFIDHSTVGAGTVVGSAPFNLLCIPGGAALVVGGQLALRPWLMAREIFSLTIALLLFQGVMYDFVVYWSAALIPLTPSYTILHPI